MVSPWKHRPDHRLAWCHRDVVQSQDQQPPHEDELRTDLYTPVTEGQRSRMIELGYSNLANNLFASPCDNLRPIIAFGTRHLRSSSWPPSASRLACPIPQLPLLGVQPQLGSV